VSCAAHAAADQDWVKVEKAIARGQWSDLAVELDARDDLVRYVHVYPQFEGRRLWHTFRLGLHPCPGQPPSLQCVHPLTKAVPTVNNVPWWPRSSNPVANLQPGTDPPYFCFPYTLEFTKTHAPLGADHPHTWTVGKHTVYVTVAMLRRLFRPGFYTGYFVPSFEEELRAAVVAYPSAFSPSKPAPSADDSAA